MGDESEQINKVGQTEEQRLSRHHVISVPPQTSNFNLDLDTSNPPNTFVNKMSVRKAKSTKPRKTAAKKAGKKEIRANLSIHSYRLTIYNSVL